MRLLGSRSVGWKLKLLYHVVLLALAGLPVQSNACQLGSSAARVVWLLAGRMVTSERQCSHLPGG